MVYNTYANNIIIDQTTSDILTCCYISFYIILILSLCEVAFFALYSIHVYHIILVIDAAEHTCTYWIYIQQYTQIFFCLNGFLLKSFIF